GPAPAGLRGRACLLMRNGKGDEVPFSWRDLRRFVGSYARPELSRRDADQALEVMGELALVREAGVRGDLRQGEVASGLQELPGPLDAAGGDVLGRRRPAGPLELPGGGVGTEAGGGAVGGGCGMYWRRGRSLAGGSVPSRLRAGWRGAETCRIRWTARTLASDSAASGPPAPLAVSSASTAAIVARRGGRSRPSS